MTLVRWHLVLMLCAGLAAACDDEAEYADDDEDDPSSGGPGGGGWDAGDGDPGGGDEGDAGVDPDVGSGPRVTIESGTLEGLDLDDGVQAFLGVPYAKPPLGELRWAPAQKPEPWQRVRAAKEFGKRCAQPELSLYGNTGSEDEDCLYLNVWTPDLESGRRLPVMVWIHGGDHVVGSSSDYVSKADKTWLYDGELLAERDVVVVTLNYRLGVLGFFAHHELREKGDKSGNQGLWDQRLALEWVRKNIAQFGGDPRNVTIFGEASGAQDVCAHVASPKSRGLFQQAIGQGAGCTTLLPHVDQAETLTQAWANQLGCPDLDCLKCLREKPLQKLMAAQGYGFGVVVEGDFLPDQPRVLFDTGDIAKVAYLLGTAKDDGLDLGEELAAIDTEQEFIAALDAKFPVPANRILEHYSVKRFADEPNPYGAALRRIITDAQLICPTYDTAIRSAYAELDVYLYNFELSGSVSTYVFGRDPDLHPSVSADVQSYWSNLARYGDPNDGELLEWPRFAESHDERMNFAREPSIVRDYRASECLFWGTVYDTTFE
jgi:para-nitrobenzyl esterase